ncbi:MAG: DUF5119 domain-containing protein [Muribaculaceae bacterium]|nr:DUF5119 domain-containing protein [Muribaculaceae bacterium]
MKSNILHKSWKVLFPMSVVGLGIASLLSSCRHKDLDFEEVPRQKVNIRFDWSNAQDASPSSMEVWLFYSPEESPDSTLRFDFNNSYGGSVKIPYGSFSGLALNSDNTDWARFRNTENIEMFEIFTKEASGLPVSGIKTRAFPRAKGAEEETLVEAPGMIYSARNDGMSLRRGETEKTFTFFPEEIVCHYTVDVKDVKNISSIDGTAVDGTLSGMAGSYMHGKKEASDSKVTIPFYLVKDSQGNSLHGEFLTFGESPKTSNPHKLSLYAVLDDGNKYLYTFDVSSQIYDAPDPKHVHIVVSGLPLPDPVIEGSGFTPDVSDWENVEIDLPM